MRARVDEALGHVPRGRRGSGQRWLRANLNMSYQNLLSGNPTTTPTAALAVAVAQTRRMFPDFEPEYDRGYFGEV